MIALNYILLKPLIYLFLIIVSNYLIPQLFFNKTGTFDFLNIINIISMIGIIGLSVFFLEYLWIAFSNKIDNLLKFTEKSELNSEFMNEHRFNLDSNGNHLPPWMKSH